MDVPASALGCPRISTVGSNLDEDLRVRISKNHHNFMEDDCTSGAA